MSFNYIVMSEEDGWETSSSVENGTSRVEVLLYGTDQNTQPIEDQLNDFVVFLCGSVTNLDPAVVTVATDDGGKVIRNLPLSHPFDSQLSVVGVPKYKGYDQEGTRAGQSIVLPGQTPLAPQFSLYKNWKYSVEFGRRPYFLLSNSFISQVSSTYYPLSGVGQAIEFCTEWQRFTTRKIIPAPDTVNATTGGQQRFRSNIAALDGTQYASQVWVFLQNSILEVMWYMVPYRYFFPSPDGVYQSYLTRFVNTVNQNAFMGFPAGSLMWLGATPEPFMPQQQDAEQFVTRSLSASQSLLCNIKMRWLLTSRTSTDIPSAGTKGLANKNNIAAGHNLQPSFTDRQFHYTTTEDQTNPSDTTKWMASYASFPHELFFTDPMLVQPGGVI